MKTNDNKSRYTYSYYYHIRTIKKYLSYKFKSLFFWWVYIIKSDLNKIVEKFTKDIVNLG